MIYNKNTMRLFTRHIRLCIGLFTIIVVCQYTPVFAQTSESVPDSSQNNYRFDNGVDSTVVRFSSKNNDVIIKAKVNGKKTFRFVLDTGAGYTLLSEKMAKKLDVPLVGEDFILGVPGNARIKYAAIDSIQIGDLAWYPGQIMVITGEYESSAIFDNFDAILGYDFFMEFPMRVNFDWKRLALFDKEKANPPKPGSAVTIDLKRHTAMKDMSLDGRPIRVLIDLGSDGEILLFSNYRWFYKLAEKYRYDPATHESLGFRGYKPIKMGKADSLKFDDIFVACPEIAIAHRQDNIQQRKYIEALLGVGIMKHYNLFIDYPNSLIYFDECKGKKK